MPENKLQIRNSTVDFLVFTKDAHEDGIAFFVQLPDPTLIPSKGSFLVYIVAIRLLLNRSPSEWFSPYKNSGKSAQSDCHSLSQRLYDSFFSKLEIVLVLLLAVGTNIVLEAVTLARHSNRAKAKLGFHSGAVQVVQKSQTLSGIV